MGTVFIWTYIFYNNKKKFFLLKSNNSMCIKTVAVRECFESSNNYVSSEMKMTMEMMTTTTKVARLKCHRIRKCILIKLVKMKFGIQFDRMECKSMYYARARLNETGRASGIITISYKFHLTYDFEWNEMEKDKTHSK